MTRLALTHRYLRRRFPDADLQQLFRSAIYASARALINSFTRSQS